jgi:hypothetical protein
LQNGALAREARLPSGEAARQPLSISLNVKLGGEIISFARPILARIREKEKERKHRKPHAFGESVGALISYDSACA